MSSLLPEQSSNETNQIPIWYEIKCDLSNNNIIVKIGQIFKMWQKWQNVAKYCKS